VRLSRFEELVSDEFGAEFSRILLADQVLISLNDLTAYQALERGIDPEIVWRAICHDLQIPKERWTGIAKKRHAEPK
jgi:hypothetical protein